MRTTVDGTTRFLAEHPLMTTKRCLRRQCQLHSWLGLRLLTMTSGVPRVAPATFQCLCCENPAACSQNVRQFEWPWCIWNGMRYVSKAGSTVIATFHKNPFLTGHQTSCRRIVLTRSWLVSGLLPPFDAASALRSNTFFCMFDLLHRQIWWGSAFSWPQPYQILTTRRRHLSRCHSVAFNVHLVHQRPNSAVK